MNGCDFMPMSSILTTTVTIFCFTCLSGESKYVLPISHHSFNKKVQTNNNFLPAQASSGLTTSASRTVLCEKWATAAKHQQHRSTEDNKEVMT